MARTWRVADAIRTIFNELNQAAPNRSRKSDGTIGDAAHATRNSDHNPYIIDRNGVGVVTAGDFTDDDENGADMRRLAAHIARTRPRELKYMIHEGRIMAGDDGPKPWVWRPYTGPNGHFKHLHISVQRDSYDSTRSWDIAEGVGGRAPIVDNGSNVPPIIIKPITDKWFEETIDVMPTIKTGSAGRWVYLVQHVLHCHNEFVEIDGHFGPGTEAAVRKVQTARGLVADGVVGPRTWQALLSL